MPTKDACSFTRRPCEPCGLPPCFLSVNLSKVEFVAQKVGFLDAEGVRLKVGSPILDFLSPARDVGRQDLDRASWRGGLYMEVRQVMADPFGQLRVEAWVIPRRNGNACRRQLPFCR